MLGSLERQIHFVRCISESSVNNPKNEARIIDYKHIKVQIYKTDDIGKCRDLKKRSGWEKIYYNPQTGDILLATTDTTPCPIWPPFKFSKASCAMLKSDAALSIVVMLIDIGQIPARTQRRKPGR